MIHFKSFTSVKDLNRRQLNALAEMYSALQIFEFEHESELDKDNFKIKQTKAWKDDPANLIEIKRWLSKTEKIFIAYLNKKIIGYAVVTLLNWTEDGNQFQLDNLYIKPEFRGCGYGKALLENVISEYGKNNSLRLHVVKNNYNAIKLYESMGFIPVQLTLDRPPSGN